MRQLFAATVNEILALNKSVPTLDEGVMYSFDGDNMRIQKKVEALLRQLHSTTTTAIKRGSRSNGKRPTTHAINSFPHVWERGIIQSGVQRMEQPQYGGDECFHQQNGERPQSLKRIWQSVQQLRDEMEIAMTVAIGEGDSAQSISRKVRQYLNDPDLMFRRFRFKKGEDEQGKPIYGRKWKSASRTRNGQIPMDRLRP